MLQLGARWKFLSNECERSRRCRENNKHLVRIYFNQRNTLPQNFPVPNDNSKSFQISIIFFQIL